jgi:hypothetical protein
MVVNDWKNLNESEKEKYNREALNDQAKQDLTHDEK